jgi:VWFA-related protein
MRVVGRSRLLVFLVAAICAPNLAFCPNSSSDPDDPSGSTYHSTVSEVRLVFFATENNRPVQDLQKDDFAVIDDERVIRTFRSFSSATALKLDLIVLFDSSESVLPNFKHEMSAVMQLVTEWPSNSEADLSVLSFSGTETYTVCVGDCRSSLIANHVDSLPKGGTTPLFDALDTATSLLSKRRQPDVLPVIILFSDGNDTISRDSFSRMLKKTLASEVQVYAVDVNGAQSSNGSATLQRIAEDSGGRYFHGSDGATKIFSEVIHDLHSARVVTYTLPQSGSDFHSVRILPTHNLSLQFRSRRGYYNPSHSTQ